MKKKAKISSIFFITLLLGSLFMPKAAACIEDYSLASKTDSYEIEKIDLTPDETYFYTELADASDIITQSRTYVENGEKLTQEEVLQIEKNLVHLLTEEENVQVQDHKTAVFLVPSFDLQRIYVIWECFLISESGEQYYFLIDDDTGKMLSFVIPVWKMKDYSILQAVENAADYYGFTQKQMTDIEVFEKEEYGIVAFFGPDGQEKMSIPVIQQLDYVYFNLYPELIGITDSKESSK